MSPTCNGCGEYVADCRCAVGADMTLLRRALASMTAERDDLRAKLAEAERELSEERADHDTTREALQETMALYQQASGHPFTPGTGGAIIIETRTKLLARQRQLEAVLREIVEDEQMSELAREPDTGEHGSTLARIYRALDAAKDGGK